MLYKFTSYYGPCIKRADGTLLVHVQNTQGVPNALPEPGDELFSPYTWGRDDDNVPGGSNHITWTAPQMAFGTNNANQVIPGTHIVAPYDCLIRVWFTLMTYAKIFINQTDVMDSGDLVGRTVWDAGGSGLWALYGGGDKFNAGCFFLPAGAYLVTQHADSGLLVNYSMIPLVYPIV